QGARLLAPQVVDRPIGRDAIQPGREPIAGVERLERDEDLEEDLLGQVCRRIPGPYEAENVIDESPLMPVNQGSERVTITRQGLVDQTLVGEGGQIRNRASNGTES